MRILFLFLDGVGLGADDAEHNPFVSAALPTLTRFTGGQKWLRHLPCIESERSTFIPTDACLGVEGRPQSATGQAAIMTGLNVPRILGYHYGPKPNALIRALIQQHSVIAALTARGLRVGFVNAFPPGFFERVNNGKRLLSSNQFAMQVGGVRLMDLQALMEGRALSVDFTGEGWRTHLGYTDVPLLTPFEAGQRLARLAQSYDLTFFDNWLTDYVAHRGTLNEAISLLEVLDAAVEGLLSAWDCSTGLIVITSDHGNIEDSSQRGHTTNPVPTLIIGKGHREFASGLTDLTHFAPRLLRALTG